MSDFTAVQLLNQPTPVIITGGYVPRGAYAAGTDYAVGDSVDYNGSSYVMFVDAAAGTLPTDTTKWQVLANKGDTGADSTVPGPSGVVDNTSGINFQEIATPANPSASYLKVYAKSDDKVYKLTSGGVESEIGAGGAQTPWTSDINAAGYKLIGNTTTTGDLTLQTTSGVGTTGADMHFLVGNNGATEAMTILNSGNVGIGTTSPGQKLHIASASDLLVELDVGATGRAAQWYLYRGTNKESWLGMAGSNNFDFWTKEHVPVRFGSNNLERVRIDTSGNVGIGTTAPTNILSLGGNSARTFWLERHTTANTAGNILTITAGGATSGATDKAGGALILQGGLSTGSAESGVTIQGCVAGASGTTDRTQTTMIQVLGNKVGFFTATPVIQQTELTDELTTITFTAPSTPDYAIQDLVDSSAGATFGFATKDEGNSVLAVIANLQARVNELETKLTAYGLLIDAD